MLHLYKLHTGELPTYLEDEFADGRQGRFWAGRLCSEVELPEVPDIESVQMLLDARHMGRRHPGGGPSKLAAIQLSFSAPKGVSVAALVYRDERILTAHHIAVAHAMQYVEDAMVCRVTHQNKTIAVPTMGLMMAIFHRYQSRSGDPHLHTNALLFNCGKIDGGKWRAIDSRTLWEEQHLIGAVYRSSLMGSLEGMGYQTIFRDDGLFEVGDVDGAVCDLFSGRRDEIAAKVHQVTKNPIGDLRGPSTVPFAVSTASRLECVRYPARLAQWVARASGVPATFSPPEGPGKSAAPTECHAVEAALATGYESLRSRLGGVKLGSLLMHCYVESKGSLSVRSLLESLQDDVIAGIYTVEGTPRTVFNHEDHIQYLERKGFFEDSAAETV